MPQGRNRFLALLLTFLSPGLGQMYNGELRKALVFPCCLPVVYVLLFGALPHMPYNGWSLLPLAFLGFVLVFGVAFLAADAWMTASGIGAGFHPRPFNRWWVYLLFFVLFHVVNQASATLRERVAAWYDIPAGSMRETIQVGDRILVDRLAYLAGAGSAARARSADGPGPQRGHLVVFLFPGDRATPYVKRVIGLPGERVEIRNNLVYIDGAILDEPYATWGAPESFGPLTVEQDAYFLLGDNRAYSSDSRTWGTVPRDLILGKVDRVLWSRDPGGRWRLDRIGKRLE